VTTQTRAADDPARTGADPEGRIAFRVRIGVTGHRTLADEDDVGARVHEALADLKNRLVSSSTEVRFTVLSALAEGADRLVVDKAYEVFGDDLRVVAVLPREAGDYMQDFKTAHSRRVFEQMLEQAARARAMPEAPSDEQGYERAGQYIVEQSDVLFALWDGEEARGRGGTAEIVTFARGRRRPVVHIQARAADREHHAETSAAAGGSQPSFPGRAILSAFHDFDAYNAGSIRERRFHRQLVRQWDDLERRLGASTIREEVLRIAAWSLPHFVRAEVRALWYQRLYHVLGDVLYLFAALAVTAVAAQTVFFPEQHRLVAVEIVCLVVLMAVVLVARRGRPHELWIGHRSLAEAFRSALFVALTGTRDRFERTSTIDLRDPHEPWYQRAFSEAWNQRPVPGHAVADESDLREFVVDAWLDHQIEYHAKTAAVYAKRQRMAHAAVSVLAGAALTVACLHFFALGEESGLPRIFTFLAIALPGFGAAVTGIREHRQYRLHGTRSRRTAERLTRLKEQMETGVRDLPLKTVVAEMQTIIVDESVEWTGVQEFQDLEMVM
jgi:hypothetical protein